MPEEGFLERFNVPPRLYKPHKLPNGRPCPFNQVPLSYPVSTELDRPVYICDWVNPGSGETCGARFDKDGNPA